MSKSATKKKIVIWVNPFNSKKNFNYWYNVYTHSNNN